MKIKKILRIILFMFLVSYILIHCTYVLREETEAKNTMMGFYAEEKDSLDVIMIGPSSCRQTINPIELWDKYKINSYSLTLSNQRPGGIIYLLKEAIKYQKNALYVIDLSEVCTDEEFWDKQNEGSLRNITDGFRYNLNRIDCINNIVGGDKFSYYFDIIKYHSNYSKEISLDEWNYKKKNYYKGFNILSSVQKITDEEMIASQENFKFTQYGQKQIDIITKYCNDNNVNVLFVVAVNSKVNFVTSEEIKKYIEDKGYRCFVFNDHFKEMKLSYEEDFYDMGHLNIVGSQKATDYFGNFLCNTYQLLSPNINVLNDWEKAESIIHEEYNSAIDSVQVIINSDVEEIEADYEIEDDTVVLVNTTKSDEVLEYAWYVYEINEIGNGDLIFSNWYDSSPEFRFPLDKNKNYMFVSFVRIKDNQESAKQKSVLTLTWDSNDEKFVEK